MYPKSFVLHSMASSNSIKTANATSKDREQSEIAEAAVWKHFSFLGPTKNYTQTWPNCSDTLDGEKSNMSHMADH